MNALPLVALIAFAAPSPARAAVVRAATIGAPAPMAQAGTPPPAQQQPPAGQPAPPAATPPPAQRTPRRPAATRTTLEFEVTDSQGSALAGVHVRATGPVERETTTNPSGVARLANVRSGTYRVRFEAEGFLTFEREVTVPAGGRVPPVEVTLNARPEAAATTPAPQPESPATSRAAGTPEPDRPVGEGRMLDVTAFIERNFIGRGEPQKVSVLGCTGYATTRLVQLREPLEDRVREDADETLFVVAGEATVRMAGREQAVQPNGLVVIPRGTTHTIERRGRNPAILLSVLSGPPCPDAAK